MTHIIYLAEGYRDDMDSMMKEVEKLSYPLHEKCGPGEKGNRFSPRVRELRLFDITLHEGNKREFLRDFMHIAQGTHVEEVSTHKFKIGLFKKLVQQCLAMVGLRPCETKHIKPRENSPILEAKRRGMRKFHGMIIGELPDAFEDNGREWV